MSLNSSTPSTFDDAVRVLDLGFPVFLLRDKPAEIATLMTERIKLTAKFLARVNGAQHSKALEVVSQALKFSSWHHLSAHLLMPQSLASHGLPARWLDSLSCAALLLSKPEPDLALPETQLEAFQRFGETLSMLADVPIQRVLDGVCAALCAGKSWQEVQTRNPLKTTHPLYTFVLDEADGSAGYFEWSPALHELVEELDEQWQGYDDFTKPEQKRARKWVENALAAQPGFLEAGLALAQMQYDADEPEATGTVDRFIRQAEALMPKGFKGQLVWSQLGNRCYHRMLWLRMTMHKAVGDLKSAVRLARKQLKLNPNDNLGLRFVLPLVLLADGDYEAAKKATKGLAGEGMTASVIRAFCEHAVGNRVAFRRELAGALISLPWVRLFLLNQRRPLPDGDDGIRGVHPDVELFNDFVWPAYGAVAGLREACRAFLAEPKVLQAEADLRRYWKGYWGHGPDRTGSTGEWQALCGEALVAIGGPDDGS